MDWKPLHRSSFGSYCQKANLGLPFYKHSKNIETSLNCKQILRVSYLKIFLSARPLFDTSCGRNEGKGDSGDSGEEAISFSRWMDSVTLFGQVRKKLIASAWDIWLILFALT